MLHCVILALKINAVGPAVSGEKDLKKFYIVNSVKALYC